MRSVQFVSRSSTPTRRGGRRLSSRESWGNGKARETVASLCGGAALEPALAGNGHYELHEVHAESMGLSTATLNAGSLSAAEAVDLLEDSPTVRLESLGLAGVDQLADRADTVPANKRFAAWSRRYLIAIATADALVGGIAAAVPASISDTLSWNHRAALLCLLGVLVWPVAIALSRGYRRNRIGIGFDEPGAVIRAGMVVVVAVALPAGFMAVPAGTLDPNGALNLLYALLKLVAVGTPLAVVLEPARALPRSPGAALLATSGTQLAACSGRWQLRRSAAAQRADSARAGHRYEGDRPMPALLGAA